MAAASGRCCPIRQSRIPRCAAAVRRGLEGGRTWVVGSVARVLGDGVVFGPYFASLKDAAWTSVNVMDAGATSLTGVAASALGVWATSSAEGG